MLSPRACHICGYRLTVDEEDICSVCNWHLPRTDFFKFAYDNTLARMFWGRIPIEKAVAYCHYLPNADTSKIIYDLKYHSQPHLGIYLGKQAALEAQATAIQLSIDDETANDNGERYFFDDIDIIVPIPITRRRSWQRGYNQSVMIAQGISHATGIPVDNKVVKRQNFFQSQTKLNVSERFANVENAFVLLRPERIRGKHVLLVDDIVTTGATMISCAKEILKAQDVKISIIAIGFTSH